MCIEGRRDLKVFKGHLQLARSKNLTAKIISGNKLIVDGETYIANQLQVTSGSSETTKQSAFITCASRAQSLHLNWIKSSQGKEKALKYGYTRNFTKWRCDSKETENIF